MKQNTLYGKKNGVFRINFILKILTILIITTLAICLVFTGLIMYFSESPEKYSEPVLFTVSKGESGMTVAHRLETEGIIRSSLIFEILLRLPGTGKGFKSGVYRFQPGMNAQTIFNVLIQGKQVLVKITIPEGLENSRIASIFENRGFGRKDEFLKTCSDPDILREFSISGPSCEGFLYPDTYLIPVDYPVREAIRMMIKRCFAVMGEILPESIAMKPEEIRDYIVLASIVEREYRAEDEAPIIAGVFYNRLKINMALQSCATVVYVITEHLGKKHPEVLYFTDIEIKDPYNTYINNGLPPGAICNPGKTAMLAAFRPTITEFLYFRLINEAEGRHHFSKTLDEHNKAAMYAVKKMSN